MIKFKVFDISNPQDVEDLETIVNSSDYADMKNPIFNVIGLKEEWFPVEHSPFETMNDDGLGRSLPGTMLIYLRYKILDGSEKPKKPVMPSTSPDDLKGNKE